MPTRGPAAPTASPPARFRRAWPTAAGEPTWSARKTPSARRCWAMPGASKSIPPPCSSRPSNGSRSREVRGDAVPVGGRRRGTRAALVPGPVEIPVLVRRSSTRDFQLGRASTIGVVLARRERAVSSSLQADVEQGTGLRSGRRVEPALLVLGILPPPAAGPLVLARLHRARAGRAADRDVSHR